MWNCCSHATSLVPLCVMSSTYRDFSPLLSYMMFGILLVKYCKDFIQLAVLGYLSCPGGFALWVQINSLFDLASCPQRGNCVFFNSVAFCGHYLYNCVFIPEHKREEVFNDMLRRLGDEEVWIKQTLLS